MKKIFSWFLIATITFFLLEFSLFLWVRYGNLPVDVPGYSFNNARRFWLDNNELFGAIHPANISYRHTKNCFDVTYTTNDFGFRGENWKSDSTKKTVVVLGDSFMEGYGVAEGDRLSNILQDKTKIVHLNFAMSGNVSPTQHYLIYKTIAKKYYHDTILIGLFPSNDFLEDDLEIGKNAFNNRYRPYWEGNYPDYKLVYYLGQMKKSSLYYTGENYLKRFLKNFTYSYNVFSYFYLLKKQTAPVHEENKTDTLKVNTYVPQEINVLPDYFNFSVKQYDKLRFSLESIRKLVPEKKIILLTIPTKEEVVRYKTLLKNPLGENLTFFCKEQNIEYVDLLNEFSKLTSEELESIYYTCDGHWNEKGHKLVADIILKLGYYSSK